MSAVVDFLSTLNQPAAANQGPSQPTLLVAVSIDTIGGGPTREVAGTIFSIAFGCDRCASGLFAAGLALDFLVRRATMTSRQLPVPNFI
jgi:hypothetical protein